MGSYGQLRGEWVKKKKKINFGKFFLGICVELEGLKYG